MSPAINVLVVEDEPLLRMDISDSLEDRGFRVHEAGTAAEALSVLALNQSIELVFTDIDMPGGMTGLELAEAVRSEWPSMAIIVTSGNHRPPSEALPANGLFLQKPYDVVTVARTMTGLLNGSPDPSIG